MAFDSMLVRDSLDRYRAQPAFLLKKLALNTVLFWTHSQTALKTMVVTFLQWR
ncbi:MAG: hypothetical protein HYS04_13295 [Acidobacteria bacterium]|nr:hypothetical protein [Acidobacteriota bacterium]